MSIYSLPRLKKGANTIQTSISAHHHNHSRNRKLINLVQLHLARLLRTTPSPESPRRPCQTSQQAKAAAETESQAHLPYRARCVRSSIRTTTTPYGTTKVGELPYQLSLFPASPSRGGIIRTQSSVRPSSLFSYFCPFPSLCPPFVCAAVYQGTFFPRTPSSHSKINARNMPAPSLDRCPLSPSKKKSGGGVNLSRKRRAMQCVEIANRKKSTQHPSFPKILGKSLNGPAGVAPGDEA